MCRIHFRTLHPGTLIRPFKNSTSLYLQCTRKRNVERFSMDGLQKNRYFRCYSLTITSTSVDNICQTLARYADISISLTPTTYFGEPEGVNIKTDSVISPYISRKACLRHYIYMPFKTKSKRCLIDFTEGFDIYGPDLLCTPSHASPTCMLDPVCICLTRTARHSVQNINR